MKIGPKDFEQWWKRADVHLPGFDAYQHHKVKQIALKAWKKRAAIERNKRFKGL